MNHILKNTFKKYISEEKLEYYLSLWNKPYRYYHNLNHLYSLCNSFIKYKFDNIYTQDQIDILLLSALFHDIIYDPKRRDNEEKSIEVLMQSELFDKLKEVISIIISDTKHRKIPNEYLSRAFWFEDNKYLYNGNFSNFVENDKLIYKEYQYLDFSLYKENRINFLNSNKEIFYKDKKTLEYIDECINYVKNWKPKVGIYAGTYKPFHNGHLNILHKAEKIFDSVIIAHGINPEKEQLIQFDIPKILEYKNVDFYSGLITDFITSIENKGVDAFLIRGLRNGNDLSYEMNQLSFINDIKPDVKSIFIICDKEFEHISSTSIRNLIKFDIDAAKKYLPI